jgi:hypothetical protein
MRIGSWAARRPGRYHVGRRELRWFTRVAQEDTPAGYLSETGGTGETGESWRFSELRTSNLELRIAASVHLSLRVDGQTERFGVATQLSLAGKE